MLREIRDDLGTNVHRFITTFNKFHKYLNFSVMGMQKNMLASN